MSQDSNREVSPILLGGVKFALGLLQLLYSIARLIPARDRIVFLSRQANRATADIVALTGELRVIDPDVTIVVLARTIKSNVDFLYAAHLLRQVWHIAHSCNIVLDSYSFLTSNLSLDAGTRVTQMWHAIGSFKRFGWDAIPAGTLRRRQLATVLNMHAGNTAVIASSKRSASNFASAFNVDTERLIVSPLPRVDHLLDPERRQATRDAVRASIVPGNAADAQILLVAPTIYSELVDSDTVRLLTGEGARHGWTVVPSYHPVTHPHSSVYSTADLLVAADAFLTDKSSMIYEAGLLGIPGFLWAPPETEDSLFAESYPSEAELRPLIVGKVDELFLALTDKTRRTAAFQFAARYVDVNSNQSATSRLARLIANS
jgi:CDP-ribitol ribitolphosphotransferase